VASLTLSVEVLKETGDVSKMISNIEKVAGVHYVKILSRE
jgi:chorismate mutase